MSQFVKISGKSRAALGTSASRRLRNQGQVPANIYGHKQDTSPISVDVDAITSVIRGGSHLVEVDVDGKVEQTLVKDVQWDTFSVNVVHVDFLRVDANERIKLEVPLQLRGSAPGAVAGGTVEIPRHAVEVECLAIQAPDFIPVRISSLNIGDSIHVRDLQDVPPGVTVLTPEETVLVHVLAPKAVQEEEAPASPEGEQPAPAAPAGE